MSKEELGRIDEILTHVRSMDAQLTWILRSESPELKKLLLSFFSKRQRAAKVFLCVDGRRSSGKIAKVLDIKVQNVSKELTELENRGLIELKKWGVYKKSKINQILRLSYELRKDPVLKEIK